MRSRRSFLLPIHVMGLLMDGHPAFRRGQPPQTKNRYLPFETVDIGLSILLFITSCGHLYQAQKQDADCTAEKDFL